MIKCCKGRFRRGLEAVADCAVAVHHAVAAVMMWISVLRSRSVWLFPCVPLAGNAQMVPCLVAWLYRGLTVPMAWYWRVCCALRTIYVMLCMTVLLNRARENRLRSRTTLIIPSTLLNLIITQCYWIPLLLPLSH